MKKFFFIFIAFALCQTFNLAHAQRYIPGYKGIQFTGGMADGKFFNSDNKAYYFGIAYSSYTKNGNRWVLGAEFLNKDFSYKEATIPMSQFTGEGGYYMNFLSDRKKTFFLSFGVSALAGYEVANWSKKLLYDGSTLQYEDKFIYGGAVTLELETYLSDRIILLINARERMLFGGNMGKFHSQYGIGLKFIIN